MARPIPSELTKWEFESESEEKSSHILTGANIAFIRNCLADAMLERAQLEYLTTNPNWTQQESSLMGQIHAYRYLLDIHETEMNRLSSLDSDESSSL
jgi:hypothetical protein